MSPNEEERRQNRARQRELFLAHEGTRYTQRYGAPLWVGEFGGMGAGPLDDQLQAFEEFGAHWTIWTYKGVGFSGFVGVDPASEYMQILAPVHGDRSSCPLSPRHVSAEALGLQVLAQLSLGLAGPQD